MIHLNIGSNLNSIHGSKFDNISIAIQLLIEAKLKIEKISNFYETPSYPNQKLPKFLNIGILVNKNLNLLKLYKDIHLIQKKIDLSQKISLVPSFSIGLYEEFDDGKDMGYPVEFKSEIELNYNLSKSSLFGVTWNHISNADIGGTNPGSDSVLINFIIKE